MRRVDLLSLRDVGRRMFSNVLQRFDSITIDCHCSAGGESTGCVLSRWGWECIHRQRTRHCRTRITPGIAADTGAPAMVVASKVALRQAPEPTGTLVMSHPYSINRTTEEKTPRG